MHRSIAESLQKLGVDFVDLFLIHNPSGGDCIETWKAMLEAAKTDPEIAKRVELYQFRVPEEFYDLREDPDGLHNLAGDPEYADELARFRKKMLEKMIQYDDPAQQAYRDRGQPGVLEAFMESQRQKAKKTKPLVRF